MQKRNSYDYDSLIECAQGNMFGKGNAQLPMPPMLMIDRITKISNEGGKNGRVKFLLNWM